MIEARCFGRSEIVTPEGRILPTSELVFAFALYMCVRAGEYVPRAELVEMFWPQSNEVKGRHSLRQMLYRLKELGFTLDEDGELLSVSPLRVRCDLADALRSDWIIEADEETIAAACDALPGLSRRFSERYGEWIDEVRGRLDAQFRRAALRVLAEAQGEGRWYDVEHWALMLLRSDPLNETAVLARAEGTAMLGSKAEAIMQLDRYLDELGPKAEKIGLPAKLLRRRIKEIGERKEGEQRLPLVGREDVVRRLTNTLLLTKDGKGAATTVTGVAGIGKTRLAAEISGIAQLIGFAQVAISPFAHSQSQTAQALGAALAGHLIELPGALAVSESALGTAKRISQSATAPNHLPLDSSATPTEMRLIEWCIAELLKATSQEKPIAVHIDDVHHLSSDAQALLTSLVESTSLSRINWLFTGRETKGIGQNIQPGRHIRLPPLSLTDSARLALALLPDDEIQTLEQKREDIVSKSGGNPFYLIAFCRTPDASEIPGSIKQALFDRLEGMPTSEKELMETILFLGPMATLPRLARIYSDSHALLALDLESLETVQGVLTDGTPDSIRLHDIWKDALAHGMNAKVSALRALQIAEFLDREPEPQTQANLAWQGHLYKTSGSPQKAAEKFQAAGDIANDRGLVHEALALYFQASSVCQREHRSIALGCRIATALLRTHQPAKAQEAAHDWLGTHSSYANADPSHVALLFALKADACFRQNNEFDAELSTAVRILKSSPIRTFEGSVALLIGMRLSLTEADRARSAALNELAEQVAENRDESLPALLARLIFSAENSTLPHTLRLVDLVERIALLFPRPEWKLLSYRYISMTLRWLGELRRSEATADRAMQLAKNLGFTDEVFSLSIQLCNLHLDHSSPDKAGDWLQHALLLPTVIRSPERERALLFTTARLNIFSKKFENVIESYQSSNIVPEADSLVRRGVLDSGCIGLASLGLGDSEQAARHAEFISRQLGQLEPSQQLDFAVDAAAYIADSLARADIISRLQLFADRRGSPQDRYLPSAFVSLSRLLKERKDDQATS